MRRVLFSLLVVGVVFALAYGAAASISIPNGGNVGSGAGTVSGYTVSNVVWVLLTSDPSKVDKVRFDLDPSTSSTTVYAKTNQDSSFSVCNYQSSSGTKSTWLCDLPDQAASGVSGLTVVAAN